MLKVQMPEVLAVVEFQIEGTPVPWKAANFDPRKIGTGRPAAYKDGALTEYQERVRLHARAAALSERWPLGFKGPARLELLICLTEKRKRGKPVADNTNIQKAVEDALQDSVKGGMLRAGLIANDRQVCWHSTLRAWGPRDLLQIRLSALAGAPLIDSTSCNTSPTCATETATITNRPA